MGHSMELAVHPMPFNAVLRCEVNGGTYGGRLTIGVTRVYFDDAELEPMPNMLTPVEWKSVTDTIESAVRELG